MPLIKRFEDIQGWQEARKLVKMIYILANSGAFVKDFGLRDQIQRAAVSAMTNIAEGFDYESKVEFARFLGIARRTAVEVQSLLYAALDVSYINESIFTIPSPFVGQFGKLSYVHRSRYRIGEVIVFKEHYDQAQKTKALIGGFKHSPNQRA